MVITPLTAVVRETTGHFISWTILDIANGLVSYSLGYTGTSAELRLVQMKSFQMQIRCAVRAPVIRQFQSNCEKNDETGLLFQNTTKD